MSIKLNDYQVTKVSFLRLACTDKGKSYERQIPMILFIQQGFSVILVG